MHPVGRVEHNGLSGIAVGILNGSADSPLNQIHGHIVEHHRGDDLVGAEAHLQPAHQQAPHCAAEEPGNQRYDDHQHARTGHKQHNQRRHQGTDVHLPLCTNID